MAHPKRKAAADALYKKLVQYPFSDVFIIWDEINSEWQTGERALKGGVVLGSDWHVVLQDDAILTPNFYDNLVGAIENVPTNVLISLYTGKVKPLPQRVQLAIDQAEPGDWLSHHMLMWGVGIALPSDHIEPLLDFVSDEIYTDTDYDIRVGMFYQRNRLPIYYTNPSLVDHDDEMGSLLAHDGTAEPRKAHRLADGIIKWTDRVINI